MSSGNRFVSSQKQTVLKQARRECEIEDLGNRRYNISKVYKYPVPKNFDKMNTGLHQYLTPLILMNLIAAKIYEVENISFTCTKWYKMIDMINDNYINMKRNIEYAKDRIAVGKAALADYFDTTDDTLIYYFKKSLEYLRDANIFNFQEINWVCVREIEKTKDESNNKDKHNIKINHVHRRATHEEMEFVRQCDQTACFFAEIDVDDNTERFYGKNSHKYLKYYKQLLLEKDILFCYKAYEIYSTDKDIERCYKLLNSFDIKDENFLVSTLNTTFRKNIIVNVEKRIETNSKKYRFSSKRDMREFISDYRKITEWTIGTIPNDKLLTDVPNKLESIDEDLINSFIDDTVHIEYNGKNLKVGVEKEI